MLLTTINSYASNVFINYYDYKDSIITMINDGNISINESCYNKNCQAKKSLAINFDLAKIDLSGGKNPAAEICTQRLGGEILMLKNSNNFNIMSFCLFSDGSILSTSTIYNFL